MMYLGDCGGVNGVVSGIGHSSLLSNRSLDHRAPMIDQDRCQRTMPALTYDKIAGQRCFLIRAMGPTLTNYTVTNAMISAGTIGMNGSMSIRWWSPTGIL